MLRAKPLRGGGKAAGYYTRDDGGRDVEARWWSPEGSLGVRDGERVRDGELRALMDGRRPDTGESMVQAQRAGPGDAGRLGGHDFHFSWNKSVSVAYAASDESTRAGIRADLHASVRDTLHEMHARGAFETRQGKGGRERGPAADVAASITIHETARDGAPQLHAHVVVVNVARRQDGRTGALTEGRAYKLAPQAGQYGGERFAGRLRARGFAVERTRGQPGKSLDGFRVAGVPRELESTFSTRRAAMVKAVEQKSRLGSVAENGKARARQMDVAAGATRKRKPVALVREQLQTGWRGTMRGAGHSAARVRSMIRDAARRLGGKALGRPAPMQRRGSGRPMEPWQEAQREHRKADFRERERQLDDRRINAQSDPQRDQQRERPSHGQQQQQQGYGYSAPVQGVYRGDGYGREQGMYRDSDVDRGR